MPTIFDLDYENFKKSLPKNLTPEEYEEAIKKWLLENETEYLTNLEK